MSDPGSAIGAASSTGSSPLLTLAIPTYMRAADLERLLSSLEPQLVPHPEIDIFICDNASPDETPAVVQRFIEHGLRLRYFRQAENVGHDANFVHCFEEARGRYFWLCGDDEAIVPGGIDLILSHLRGGDLDILYLSSYDFREDYMTERTEDKFGRNHHTFNSAADLIAAIHINLTFISGVITHRERLLGLPHEAPGNFVGTNLVQLSWIFPLLRAHRRSRVLWRRTVASRWLNSGGYSFARVFGNNLSEVTRRLLGDRQDLSAILLNKALRVWYPSTLLGMRERQLTAMQFEETRRFMEPLFRRNLRYWLFVYPALVWPLAAAGAWVRLARKLNSLASKGRHPLFWRKTT